MSNKFIIIPAYNEARRISHVISDIREAYGNQYKIVVVNDGSSDNTASIAEKLDVKVLKHSINRDQGAALVTGTKYALSKGADYVLHFDADGQHSVKSIGKLISPLEGGKVDVVLGSRFLNDFEKVEERLNGVFTWVWQTFLRVWNTKNIPTMRRVLIFGNIIVNTLLTGVLLSDAHNGLRSFSRKAAEIMRIRHDGKAHATEYISEIHANKLSYIEVPVDIFYNQAEKRSQNFFDGVSILKDIIIKRIMH